MTTEPKKSNRYTQPSSYKPEYCEGVIAHMSKGLSFESFSATIGVSRMCVFRWLDAHEEFRAAVEGYAKPACLLFWEDIATQVRDKEINTALVIFNMHNRFRDFKYGGWRKGDPSGTHNALFGEDGKIVGFAPVEGYQGSDKI